MNITYNKFLMIVLFLILAINGYAVSDSWPMFQHDAQHTGRSPYVGIGNPQVKWTVPFGSYSPISPPIIGSDGTLYIGIWDASTHEGSLWAIDSNGSIKWTSPSFTISGFCCWSDMLTGLVSNDGTIFIGGTSGLYALNPNGSIKFHFSPDYSYNNGLHLTLGENGTIYGVNSLISWGASDGHVFALKPNGSLEWDYHDSLKTLGWNPIAVGLDGTIYTAVSPSFSDGFATILAVHSNGSKKWAASICCGNPGTMSVNNAVYFIADNDIAAYLPNGTLLWINQSGCYGCSGKAIALDTDGTLVFGSRTSSGNSSIRAFTPNGKQKWIYKLNNSEVPSQPIIDGQGTIYVGVNLPVSNSSGKLLALNNDGTIRWSLSAGTVPTVSNIIQSPLALSSDGAIYTVIYNGTYNLYAFGQSTTNKTNSTPPSNSSFIWPIQDPIITQDYACYECYKANRKFHTGIDAISSDHKSPIKATSAGEVVNISLTSDKTATWCDGSKTHMGDISKVNHGFGNVVILKHDSIYSLYGHLDCINISIVEKFLKVNNQENKISQGEQIGIMGNSDKTKRVSSLGKHLHFEIKNSATLSDSSGKNWGYAPNLSGYHDPIEFLHQVDNLTPIVIQTTDKVNVRPGPYYDNAMNTLNKFTKIVAYRQASNGGEWYQINLAVPENNPNPNLYSNGIEGWISKSLAQTDNAQIARVRDGIKEPASIYSAPGKNKIALAWSNQYFAVNKTISQAINKCNNWIQIFLGYVRDKKGNFTSGWICNDFIEIIP